MLLWQLVHHILLVMQSVLYTVCKAVVFTWQGGDGFNHYKVRARMAIMDKNFKLAESIYLEQVGTASGAIYRQVQRHTCIFI